MAFSAAEKTENPMLHVIEPVWDAAVTDAQKALAILTVGQIYSEIPERKGVARSGVPSNSMPNEAMQAAHRAGIKRAEEGAVQKAGQDIESFLTGENIQEDISKAVAQRFVEQAGKEQNTRGV